MYILAEIKMLVNFVITHFSWASNKNAFEQRLLEERVNWINVAF